ncbi:MAG: hypothetical protein LBW77_01540 [Verrucomicrobiota bacterium]|jgi:hypothetical protein|nr:hypothetical protein [Verrucomicrobiota bacterium]
MKNLPDPVEAVFDGLNSGFVRGVIGLITIFAILAGCAALGGGIDSVRELSALVFPLVLMLLAWGAQGGLWFFWGLFACLAMWGGLIAFVRTDEPKISFFLMVSGALAYFVLLADSKWYLLLGFSYPVFAILYWRPSRFLPWRFSRDAAQADEVDSSVADD